MRATRTKRLRDAGAAGGLKRRQLRAIVAAELREERGEGPIDEINDARLACAWGIVGGNDLCGDGFNVRASAASERELLVGAGELRRALRPWPARPPSSPKGVAVAMMAAMACRSDRRERLALSMRHPSVLAPLHRNFRTIHFARSWRHPKWGVLAPHQNLGKRMSANRIVSALAFGVYRLPHAARIEPAGTWKVVR